MRSNVYSIRGYRIPIAIAIGILLGCVFALCFPHGFFASNYPSPIQDRQITKINLQLDLVSVTDKNAELKKQCQKLTEKSRLSEQRKDKAQKQFSVLGNPHKVGSFGIFAKSRSRNEPIVASANSKVKEVLEVWFNNIKSVGILNYLVIALDDNIAINMSSFRVEISCVKGVLAAWLRVLLSDVDIVYLQDLFDHIYRIRCGFHD
ncbi:hypothetical protein MKW92_016171 [Papaver armeniacum]|nr:hypothetical protein MKW92_016171 [Papaver armeniacum]